MNKKGYTLKELLVVIGVFSVIYLIGAISVSHAFKYDKIDAEYRSLLNILEVQAKNYAQDNDAKLFNSHNNYNRINNIKNDNKLFFRIIFKKNKNQRNKDLENSSTKRIQTQQNLMNSNDNELNELYEMIRKNTIKKDEKSNIDSSLNNTIKFSKCTSKTEEEGELGLDEIQDIIIFYNLGKEIHRDYLFKKNDYFDFKQKYKNIYYKYFMK